MLLAYCNASWCTRRWHSAVTLCRELLLLLVSLDSHMFMGWPHWYAGVGSNQEHQQLQQPALEQPQQPALQQPAVKQEPAAVSA
jgi:hypothetical protein